MRRGRRVFGMLGSGFLVSLQIFALTLVGALPLGMLVAFARIVLPQVVKRVMPSVTNEVITLVKDTSLAFSIGVIEMFTVAKQLVASQVSMLPFAIAAAFYWVFNLVVDALAGQIERKLG